MSMTATHRYFLATKKALAAITGWLTALLLIVMTTLVVYQVFTRYVLNSPADFTEELSRYMLIWTGFIGGAYAFVTRQHIALLLFRNKLPFEKKRYVMVFTDLIVFAFALLVIVIGGAQLAISAAGDPSALLGIPRGLVYAVAPIAGVFIAITQIINVWESWTGNVLLEEDEDD